MKTLIDAHSDRILGFTAFGPEAGELIGMVQLAMLAGKPYTVLRNAMFAHPTMTVGLKGLFMAIPHQIERHAGQVHQTPTPRGLSRRPQWPISAHSTRRRACASTGRNT